MGAMRSSGRRVAVALGVLLLVLGTASAVAADEPIAPPPILDETPLAPADVATPEVPAPERRLVRAPASCPEPCCPKPCDPCDACRSRWTLGLYASGSVFEDPTGPVGEPVPGALSWARNTFDSVAGGRLRLAYRPNCDDEFEGRLIFYGKADARSRQTGRFGFGRPPVASPLVTATLENESIVWGLDANYWRTLSRCGALTTRIGAGWRYMRIDEKATARDLVAVAPGFLESDARNTVLAAQLMAGASWRLARRLELMGDVKLIGGAVASDVDMTDDSLLSGGRKRSEDSETNFGWGVEATLEGRVRIARRLFVRGGYELFFLDGVQGATDAADFTRPGTGAVQPRFRSSSRLIQTVFLGLDIEF